MGGGVERERKGMERWKDRDHIQFADFEKELEGWLGHVPVFLLVLDQARWIKGCGRSSRRCQYDMTWLVRGR